jgi:AraC-like DNA-binding protein/ligand-binding sensor protein
MVRNLLTPPDLKVAAPRSVADEHSALLRCLRESKLFLDYQQSFEIITGFPLVLRAVGSFQVPLHGSKHSNPFCELMTRANKTCSACLQLQQRTETEAVLDSKTLQCYAGLHESVVPVRVGDDVLGYLQTGQVFFAPPTARRFNALARMPFAADAEIVRAEFKSAYFQTRVVSPTQYEAVIQMLVIFAKHLASVGNQLLTSQTVSESPVISKARAFIAEHQGEALGLPDIAQAVHMSPIYFCKFFKRATGLTFTAYLARTRIQSVKRMLQNVHMRISEAAFASGFQSLSQFNRVFRRVAGESPTEYRARLHGPLPRATRPRVSQRKAA